VRLCARRLGLVQDFMLQFVLVAGACCSTLRDGWGIERGLLRASAADPARGGSMRWVAERRDPAPASHAELAQLWDETLASVRNWAGAKSA